MVARTSSGTAATKRRRPATGATSKRPSSRGKQAGESAFDDSTDFFLADEEDQKRPGGSESDDSDEEDIETADEKRLRLAKAYLERVRQQAVDYGSEEEEDEESGDGDIHRESGGKSTDGVGLHDRVSSQLQKDFMETTGHAVRQLARHVRPPEDNTAEELPYGHGGRLMKGHHWSVTGLALTVDDSTAFSVSKDGSLLRWDVETGTRTKIPMPGQASAAAQGSGPDWVLKQARREAGAQRSLLAVAVSTDGRYVAAGGGDAAVHVWDARSNSHIKSLRSHKEAITGLAFREGEPTLYSSSYDRTVKIWSLSEMAYVDTLYGHQSEVLSVTARRAERCVSTGNDFTCRMWKIPEESQLVFRGRVSSIDCSCYVSTAEWMTGSTDGSLSLWNPMRKKPVFTLQDAHQAEDPSVSQGAAGVGGAAAWVQSVAWAWGSDLAASGAGDGKLRLWQVGDGRHGKTLAEHSSLPAKGFVNALAVARSGRFVLAGLGQEPRLGRWARNPRAKNGVLLHSLVVNDSES